MTTSSAVAAAVICMMLLMVSGCGTSAVIEKSLLINAGDSKQQVLSIFGQPENRQFSGEREAWQWCSTALTTEFSGGDDFVIVWFNSGKVVSVSTYKNNQVGDCRLFFRTIKWQ